MVTGWKEEGDYGLWGRKAALFELGGKVESGKRRRRRKTRRRRNLDEEEELSEAGQQGQKAPQDAVVHVPQLMMETGGREGGRTDRQKNKNKKIQAAGRKKNRGRR